jgi:hypothetical protein
MDLSPYVSALRDNLTAAAAAGDEQTRNAARALIVTLEPATRLAIMNALADLAAEVTVALEDRVVDVRLSGQDVHVVVTGGEVDDEPAGGPAEPPPSFAGDNGDISRITVRLLEELKTKAEQAAAAQGVSMNSFVAQAVQGALGSRNRGRRGSGRSGGDWGDWGNFGNWSDWAGGGEGGQQEPDRGKGKGRGDSHRVRGWVEG